MLGAGMWGPVPMGTRARSAVASPRRQGHVAPRLRSRTRLYAAVAKVTIQSTSASPQCRSFRKPPRVFIHPRTSSTNFRFR